MSRSAHYRQAPLDHAKDRIAVPVSDECCITVYAASGYVAFIEALWHGDYQQVPVDPDEIDNLIEALGEVKQFLAESRA